MERQITVYHGTSSLAAESICAHGVLVERSCGGYFGVAFYVTEDRELAQSNYADWCDEDDGLPAVLRFEMTLTDGCLDLSNPEHWDRWIASGLANRINEPRIAELARAAGIAAVWDENSVGGWAVYDPSILTLKEDK